MSSKYAVLVEGDVIELEVGHLIFADLPSHFVHCEMGCFDLSSTSVVIGEDVNGLKTDFFAGKYVVTGVEPMEQFPGSTRLGYAPSKCLHTTCERIDGNAGYKVRVRFIQDPTTSHNSNALCLKPVKQTAPKRRLKRKATEDKAQTGTPSPPPSRGYAAPDVFPPTHPGGCEVTWKGLQLVSPEMFPDDPSMRQPKPKKMD